MTLFFEGELKVNIRKRGTRFAYSVSYGRRKLYCGWCGRKDYFPTIDLLLMDFYGKLADGYQFYKPFRSTYEEKRNRVKKIMNL